MENENNLDRALDTALAQYAAVEPRPGLEDCILANLRTQPTPVSHTWLRWSLAAVAAVVIIAAAIAWRSRTAPPKLVHTPTIQQKQAPATVAHETPQPAPHPKRHTLRHTTPTQVAAAPKLDVFPSPQPLSEQEKILAAYIQQYRAQAVFVAQARADLQRKDLEEEARLTRATPDGQHQEIDTTNR